jgi:branched-chain amino acid transport system substrate-binding protein
MFSQAKQMGADQKIKVFAEAGNELQLGKALGSRLPQNTWSVTWWYYGAHPDNPLTQSLVKDYTAKTGDTAPRSWTERGFTSIRLYADAIAADKSTETPAVIAALENGRFTTASGPFNFRKEDHEPLGTQDVIHMSPRAEAPGWGVVNSVTISTADIAGTPSPGQPFKG